MAPPVQVFYSSKLRARLLWWKQEKAPRRVLQALQKGVDLEFEAGPPAPFSSAPILVSEKDVDFVVKDLEKGDRLGAYTPLVAGGEDYLSRARVDTRPNGKQRLVLNFRRINAACRMDGINYSRFIDGLNKCDIKLNRKMLSEIAIHDPAGFSKVVETAKAKVC